MDTHPDGGSIIHVNKLNCYLFMEVQHLSLIKESHHYGFYVATISRISAYKVIKFKDT
jgi:hypothetical protein